MGTTPSAKEATPVRLFLRGFCGTKNDRPIPISSHSSISVNMPNTGNRDLSPSNTQGLFQSSHDAVEAYLTHGRINITPNAMKIDAINTAPTKC
jgi:hypothetical protein